MHGIGNDYIYLDCIANPMPNNIEQFARHASDRHTGIGGDGVVLILPSDIADCRMRMFNADGSEGRMCGNAIRCVGKYYYETNISKTQNNSSFLIPHSSLTVETLSGIKHLTLNIIDNKVDSVTVDMGIPSLQPTDIPIHADHPFINQPISISKDTACCSLTSETSTNSSFYRQRLKDLRFLIPHSSLLIFFTV